MNKKDFINLIDSKIKLIRSEKNFTQDKMAEVIGISKKTLVQIEKQRASLGWAGSITVCSLFKDSEILQMTFGGDPEHIILSIAFEYFEEDYKKTMGGKVWWNDVVVKQGFKIQKNIVSNHYRILDNDDRRILSSFNLEYVSRRLEELCNNKNF